MNNLWYLLSQLSMWVAPVFYKVLFITLTASLVGVVVLLVEKILDDKISPLWKYLLWGIMLVALLVPVRPHSAFSIVSGIEGVQEISYREEYEEATSALAQTEQELGDGTVPQQIQEMRHRQQRAYWKTMLFDVALPLFWLFGVIAALLFFAGSRINLMLKLRGQTLQDKEIIRLMQQCKQEMGVRREIPVLMPQCAHWFNPAIWYLFQQLRADMELLNDSFVLNKIGAQQSKAYAKSLVAVLGYSRNIALMPRLLSMTDGKKNVERRIDMIRMGEKFKQHRVWIAAGCILLIAVIALLFLTTKPITAQQAADMLLDSIKNEEGMVSFTIPRQYDPVEDWTIEITCNTTLPGNTSVNQYFFAEENTHKSWKKGKTYTIPLKDPNGTKLTMEISLPGGVSESFELVSGASEIENNSFTGIRFEEQEQESATGFQVVAKFPAGWETQPYDESVYIPGNFDGVLAIYDGNRPIAAIGYSEFTPYEEEIPQEEYYKTVYPDLRLSSIFCWDEYQPVKTTETGETALTNIWYCDPKELDNYMGEMPDCPILETSGILSYDKSLGVYVGIAFDPEQIERAEVEALAKTLQITN